jgi:hypothetical protein
LGSLGGGLGGSAPAGGSDFTRIIARSSLPSVPDAPTPPPATGRRAGRAPAGAPNDKRPIPVGLILIINAVILLAVLLVFFLLRRPVPSVPSTPSLPSAPAAPTLPSR